MSIKSIDIIEPTLVVALEKAIDYR